MSKVIKKWKVAKKWRVFKCYKCDNIITTGKALSSPACKCWFEYTCDIHA